MASLSREALLPSFKTTLSWADCPSYHKSWRPIRGEGVQLLPDERLPDAPPPMPDNFVSGGRHVGNHSFALGEILGEGNYSQVFEATLKPTQEKYAFKVVDKQRVERYKKRDEVLVEKWVLSNIQHPSMIRIFQSFQDRGCLYLVLEHVPGGELWAKSHRTGIRRSLTTFYVAQLLEVLQHLHEHNVVHRDVKPENVLLTTSGHIKLIDFGTAKLINHEPLKTTANYEFGTTFKNFVGTPEYMAPEAINNKPADYRSDLWSIGCFACQLLAGNPPFKGGSDYLTFKRVIGCHYVLPEGMCQPAADLLQRLFQLKPQERLGGEVEIEEAAAGRHDKLREHSFFASLAQVPAFKARELHKLPLPLPTLAELCLEHVVERFSMGGWMRAALLGPPPSKWPIAVRDQVVFDLIRSEKMTDELRATLGLGPPPPQILDAELLKEDLPKSDADKMNDDDQAEQGDDDQEEEGEGRLV
mmetsp:Transcript_11954/g.20173  ORF Transcript_11954/g.20173 Transcript_11954/m.20173 type:complete len:471 (+) Transcript_11954:53-1465(+)|eukprot:CAMPEP_0119334376 /NCGR_PEP_ID=MMETSP1333-20130426/87214_1 /TAXON_ID=418940 /ORGANISM="Scyphosphaera apsteinii, Strain RCC1455" /LENGTH=470 /DNA_ID=CAMNT_0007344657 /DNA_START=57 /DNA_END=1469 /DNA_ORIENTATION=-